MVVLRRWLVLVAFAFWQGGFMFYGAVVVPVGSDILGSHREQARITRPVTNYLNVAGAVALAVWCWDGQASRRKIARGGRLFWPWWALLVLLLGVQVGLHWRMDDFLDTGTVHDMDRQIFRFLHRCYLLVSSVQWAGAMGLLAWTVCAWARCDHAGEADARTKDGDRRATPGSQDSR
jgi:hypothetical protein